MLINRNTPELFKFRRIFFINREHAPQNWERKFMVNAIDKITACYGCRKARYTRAK